MANFMPKDYLPPAFGALGARESHRTYRIRYVTKYVNTEGDPYTYGYDTRASGTRRYVTDHVRIRYGTVYGHLRENKSAGVAA